MTLADFLLARIAEDEGLAHRLATANSPSARMNAMTGGGAMVVLGGTPSPFDPARVLADCEAKRRIVGDCVSGNYWASEANQLAHSTLEYLALPYADHPDYRDEWRP